MRAHAPGPAATFLEQAARLRPGDARLLFTLGTALHRDGQYPAARARLEEALLVERDALRRARILLQLTELHRATRNTAKATTTIAWGLAELDAPLPDGSLFRAIGAIRAGLVALFVSVTGWGFGTARSRDRERQALLAALHLVAGHLGEVNLRPASLLMHRLHGARAAVRLGSGVEFSLSCAAVGLTAARYGLSRLRRRSLALAEQAAADLGDPQIVAQVAWYSGTADYLSRVDNGERWIQCLTDHGQWLTSEQYSDTISAACWDAAVQGRNDDVLRWVESGRSRRAFRGTAELTSLLTIPAIGLTAADHPTAANAELSRLRTVLEQHGGRSLRVNLVLAELYTLIEQNHLDEHFDAVAERFFAFTLPTIGMLRQHQSFYSLYAQGRLAKCRSIRPAAVPPHVRLDTAQLDTAQLDTAQLDAAQLDTARLDAARVAVRQLRSVTRTPLLAAVYQQCRAELLVLEGRPKRALAVLSRLKPQRQDAPLLGFEIALTTARALFATGYPADARRQVLNALNLAEEHGWTSRRRLLAAEFGLPSAESRLSAAFGPPSPGFGPTSAAFGVPATESRPAADSRPPAIEFGLPAAVPISAQTPLLIPVQGGSERGDNRELDLATILRDTLLKMSSTADPMDVLQKLVASTERALPEGRTWLIRPAPQIVDGDAGSLAGAQFFDLPAPGTVCELVFDPDLRALATTCRPVLGDCDRIVAPQLRRLLADAASWLLFPLVCDGMLVGVLVLASARPLAYADTEIAVVGALAAQGMVALAKARLIARVQELTGIDELTGVRSLRQIIELANRDVQGARHSSRPLVVLVIGIDHLGRINDLHGRTTGDDVIRQVANRLRLVIRETDLIGRYRQDEFVVVLSQGRDGEDGIRDGGLDVAERLLRTVSQSPLQTRVGRLPITVTIGQALMNPDDGNFTALAARAEMALQAAKLGGRNRVQPQPAAPG